MDWDKMYRMGQITKEEYDAKIAEWQQLLEAYPYEDGQPCGCPDCSPNQ